jgi:hypothetical protein
MREMQRRGPSFSWSSNVQGGLFEAICRSDQRATSQFGDVSRQRIELGFDGRAARLTLWHMGLRRGANLEIPIPSQEPHNLIHDAMKNDIVLLRRFESLPLPDHWLDVLFFGFIRDKVGSGFAIDLQFDVIDALLDDANESFHVRLFGTGPDNSRGNCRSRLVDLSLVGAPFPPRKMSSSPLL